MLKRCRLPFLLSSLTLALFPHNVLNYSFCSLANLFFCDLHLENPDLYGKKTKNWSFTCTCSFALPLPFYLIDTRLHLHLIRCRVHRVHFVSFISSLSE